MKLYEYRTDGTRVLWRETASTVVLWRDAVSTGNSMSMTAKAAGILTEGWRTMTPAEVNAWCFGAKAIPAGIPDDDWQGMYNVAAKRAVLAEAEVRSLQTALAALKARDIRICLHCGREQEGVK
jgi:hypothetical protein